MVRQRPSAAELARLLNSANQPIYVIDDEQTIVFCNQACLNWIGRTAEELLGRRCAYHSSPEVDGADAVAAGLCPPPAALAGEPVSANVAWIADDGRPRERRATFLPLGISPEDVIGVVAVLEPRDLPATKPLNGTDTQSSLSSSEEPDAAELHERIRRFRSRIAARYRVERLVGDSPAMRRARSQVELAACNRASVEVVGPPGSGRHHVAAAIHYADDSEPTGSLIPLACSALGAELIHSTITALATRNPLGKQAARSTLLLNDADQLPPEVQSELAEVFASKTFVLRLISTVRKPLAELARRDEYRHDLAAVLSTIVIELPPLAQRRADLPLLAQLFLEEANARGEKQVGGFSPEALDRLDAYSWPGDVDELIRVVDESYERAEGRQIGVGDLPRRIHLAADASAHPRRVEETIVLDEFLSSIEEELIRRALGRAKGNKTRAAKSLGITRPRLYRRLVQLGLEEGGGR